MRAAARQRLGSSSVSLGSAARYVALVATGALVSRYFLVDPEGSSRLGVRGGGSACPACPSCPAQKACVAPTPMERGMRFLADSLQGERFSLTAWTRGPENRKEELCVGPRCVGQSFLMVYQERDSSDKILPYLTANEKVREGGGWSGGLGGGAGGLARGQGARGRERE